VTALRIAKRLASFSVMNLRKSAISLYFLIGISCPFVCSGEANEDPWIRELARIKYFGLGIQFYRADYDPLGWPGFEELIKMEGEVEQESFRKFVDPLTGEFIPWIYMPEGKPKSGAGRVILVAAPRIRAAKNSSNGKESRAVFWSDFTADFLDEAIFQRRVKRRRGK